MRRYQELTLIIGVILWCTTVLYLYRSQDTVAMTRENQHELDRAFSTMNELQKQNMQLQKIVSQISMLKVGNASSEQSAKLLMEMRSQLKNCQGNTDPARGNSAAVDSKVPSKDHEVLRRRVHNGVVELLYSIETELKHIKQSGSPESNMKGPISRLSMQQRTILINLEDLDKLNNDWKQKESKELQDLVRKRMEYIQNPKDCGKAKQLLCRLNKGCGFGCQIHHLTYCFMIAYGTERTLIVDSQNWRYEPGGWEIVFQPASTTCTKASGTAVTWKGEEQSKNDQVVLLPIVDGLPNRPPYMPLGIPEDLAPRLFRLHGDPSVWWVGQFMRYLLRPQKWLEDDIAKVEREFGFKSPVVGIQVRRTDKVGTEAAFHGIEEYMKHVVEWFDKYDMRLSRDKTAKKAVRRVYIATDEPAVLPEAKEKFPDYVFISDQSISQSAQLSSRYTKASLRGVILDIFFLSKCDYLVCTFSSQVCRVAYELMQTLHPDASALFHSLDDIYYYGGQTGHEQRAVFPHKPRSGELELEVGDVVGIAGNHWDGQSKGSNRRTGQVGLYPSYKMEEIIRLVKYPTYPEADAAKR